jgi:DNA-binding response OmpR family regulator
MKPQILVVDDSMVVRMDLRGALMAAGCEVTTCSTKQAAEELLNARTFDALVLDVVLPDGDGVDILKRVRADVKHAPTPVIMLSNEADVRDRVRGLTTGADEYVGKPYNIAYFVRRLRELCVAERASKVPPPGVVACRRILAVDDSPTFLEYIAQMLRQDGHDVVLAPSGIEALEMLAAQTIDCVVLDLHMPGLDGIETIRQIRQTSGRESTPALMLTSTEDPNAERNATSAGVDGFLSKAVPFSVIRDKIHQLLRKHRSGVLRTNSCYAAVTSSTRTVTSLKAAPSSTTEPMRHREANTEGAAFTTNKKMASTDFSTVFVEAASAMGLSCRLAHDTLTKTLSQMGIDPRKMDHEDLARALPAIRKTLGMFFPTEEITPRVQALATIATRAR